MCFGGGSTPAPPPPPPPPPLEPIAPPPPPQLAKTPEVRAVQAAVSAKNVAQGGGTPSTTLLTGGMGDVSPLGDKLSKKTLLGR